VKSHVRFKAIEEVIHHFGIGRHNFNVFRIVVAVSALDLIKNTEAVFQFFIKHHVMNSPFHLSHFLLQLVFLLRRELIVMVAALGEVYLEIDLSLLELIFVGI